MNISIPSSTSTLLDGINAHIRRINTALSTFTTPEGVETADAEINRAQDQLRLLRLHVRQIKASAKAAVRAQRRAA